MNHIVLLDDSILDNATYVAGGPEVRTQLRERFPHDWRGTLLAVDGDRTQDVQSRFNGCHTMPAI